MGCIKILKYIKNRILMVANGDAEATNNFQRYIDGYAFVTRTMMHEIQGQTSNQENI